MDEDYDFVALEEAEAILSGQLESTWFAIGMSVTLRLSRR